MSRAKGQKDTRTREARTNSKLTQTARTKAMVLGTKGLSPLEYLLERMRDPKEDKAVRLDAAKAAAPYVHPKLMSTHVTGGPQKSHEEWVKELASLDADADAE